MPKDNTKEDEILDTLSGLTEAVGSGFDKVNNHLEKLDGEVAELRSDMNNQFREVNAHLDRIEHSILEEHARRIEALERKVGLAQ